MARWQARKARYGCYSGYVEINYTTIDDIQDITVMI